MKYLKYIGVAVMALSVGLLASCSDDDDSSAAMSVNSVYLEDASSSVTNHDRQVEFARLGQLIRIQGSGFTGLKKIYINGYETYFNNALMTDNNVWVTLNSKTPVAGADESVRNKIRLYKSDDNYLDYDFVIRAAAPSVSSISLTLPQPGEKVTVYGSNLQETTTITLPDGTVVNSGIESDEDGEYYTFTMPSDVDNTIGGSIISEGANGTAKTPACFNERRGMILDLDGNGVQGGWSATYTSDQVVADPLNSGRGNVFPLIPEDVQTDGGIGAGTQAKGWFTAGNGTDPVWADAFSCVDPTTDVSNIALQFDIYCPEEWNNSGMIEFTFQNNLSNYGWGSTETTNTTNISYPTAVVWVPWMDRETGENIGPFKTEGWQTITIPLSLVGKYQNGGTFADVSADREAASYKNFGMFFVNKDIEFSEDIIYPSARWNQKVYIDNWRIVPYEKFTISDFND